MTKAKPRTSAESILLFCTNEPIHGYSPVDVPGWGTIYVRAEASERHYSVSLDDADPAPWETFLNSVPV